MRREQSILLTVAVLISLVLLAWPRADLRGGISREASGRGSYHWRLGTSKYGPLAEMAWLGDSWSDDNGARLRTTNGPLNVVPKKANLPGLYHRHDPPIHAVYIDRPPVGSLVDIPINCISTADRATRSLTTTSWTVEAVVYFLDSPHLGRAWQGIIGRDGGNYSRNADLSTLYLKLDPDKRFMLEAWIDDGEDEPAFISIVSDVTAERETWYSVVGQGDGEYLSLFVNGVAVGRREAHGSLAASPLTDLGDFTFGCAMHAGRRSDPCSCLLSEVRISDHAVSPGKFLWRNASRGESAT